MPILLHAMLLLASAVQASEPVVTLSGTLVDAQGKPMPAAAVVVAEGPPALWATAQGEPVAALRAPEALAAATSDGSGKFSVALPDEAPEVAWRRTRLTVWAYHPDCALAVQLIDRDWPRAGLPLTVRLPAAGAVRFKVTDADYEPVAHASITPLRVAGHLLPEALRQRLAAETGDDGRATLAGVAPADLETVRVANQAIGEQWTGLPAKDRDRIVLINLASVGRLTGQLTADDPRAAVRRTLRFTTWQIPGDDYSGGGFAEAITDEEGKFDVPAIAAGSLTFEIKEDGLPSPSRGTSTTSEGHPTDNPPIRTTTAPVYLAAQSAGP